MIFDWDNVAVWWTLDSSCKKKTRNEFRELGCLSLKMFEESCTCTYTNRSVHPIRSHDGGQWNIPTLHSNSVFSSKEQNREKSNWDQKGWCCQMLNRVLHLSLIFVALFSLTFNVKSQMQGNHYFEKLFCSLMDLIDRKWVLIFSQNQAFQKQVLFVHFPSLILLLM